MNSIQKLIEDVLGEYNEEVDKVVWGQIQRIIKTTGKFNADDYILQVVQPDIKADRSTLMDGHDYVFSIKGAVRLVPKPQIPRVIKESILEGAQIRHYSVQSLLPNYTNIIIKGYQDVDMVVGGQLRFNFELDIKTSDTRLTNVIEESLGY